MEEIYNMITGAKDIALYIGVFVVGVVTGATGLVLAVALLGRLTPL